MNPSSTVWGGGGVHGKVSWLIAYNDHCTFSEFPVRENKFRIRRDSCEQVQWQTKKKNNFSAKASQALS